MSRDVDREESLRRIFVRALVEETAIGEVIALPIASGLMRYFQRHYPGSQLYIPKPVREYDLAHIESDLRASKPPGLVARSHGTTLRQLHRLFPGGLPKPSCDGGDHSAVPQQPGSTSR